MRHAGKLEGPSSRLPPFRPAVLHQEAPLRPKPGPQFAAGPAAPSGPCVNGCRFFPQTGLCVGGSHPKEPVNVWGGSGWFFRLI